MQINTILERVKAFLIRFAKDSAFVAELQTSSIDQVNKVLNDAGYRFTQEEFETAVIQLLDLKERDEFHELTEEELVGAVGGWLPIMRPRPFPRPFPRPYPKPSPSPKPIDDNPIGSPIVQPMYGVVIEPPMEIQPMYGVVISPDIV